MRGSLLKCCSGDPSRNNYFNMTSSAFFQGLDLFHSFFEEIECSLECHALLRSSRKEKRKVSAKQRLTFPFPFVHHQPHDWKVEQLLTVERRTLKRRSTVHGWLFLTFQVILRLIPNVHVPIPRLTVSPTTKKLDWRDITCGISWTLVIGMCLRILVIQTPMPMSLFLHF